MQSCNCGHEHPHLTKEKFEEAVKRFISTLPADIDIDKEYEKIQKKESNLSRSQRDTIEAIVEFKKEHHFEEDNSNVTDAPTIQ